MRKIVVAVMPGEVPDEVLAGLLPTLDWEQVNDRAMAHELLERMFDACDFQLQQHWQEAH